LGANALKKSSETAAGMASIFPMCLRSNILRHLAISYFAFRAYLTFFFPTIQRLRAIIEPPSNVNGLKRFHPSRTFSIRTGRADWIFS
jgi:hypothetical protein